jgi:hypothetical protein
MGCHVSSSYVADLVKLRRKTVSDPLATESRLSRRSAARSTVDTATFGWSDARGTPPRASDGDPRAHGVCLWVPIANRF